MDLGADMVEVDVQVSRDGGAVLFHDANLGRLARAAAYTRRALRSLRIHDLSVADLKQLDVGSWMNEKFAGLSIPTLDEFLSAAGGRIALNLELKMDGADGQRHAMIDRLGEALTSYPAPESVLMSSFDGKVLELVRAALPHARVGVLLQPGGVRETLRLAERVRAVSVHL